MRVLVCGDRNWKTARHLRVIQSVLTDLVADATVITGGAQGVDTLARLAAFGVGLRIKIFPADWRMYGRAAGPIRNKQMLVEGQPDLVIAFHDDIMNSKGTRNMITQSSKAGVPSRIYDSSGAAIPNNWEVMGLFHD